MGYVCLSGSSAVAAAGPEVPLDYCQNSRLRNCVPRLFKSSPSEGASLVTVEMSMVFSSQPRAKGTY